MAPEVLCVAKLAAAALVLDGFFARIDGPFVPVADWPWAAGLPAGFGTVLQAGFWITAGALLVNRWPRAASVACGAIVLAGQAVALPAVAGHALLLGFLLVLAGLEAPGRRPVLLRAQMALVFLLAAAGKAATPEWRDGAIVLDWLHAGLPGLFMPAAGGGVAHAAAAAAAWALVLAQAAAAAGLAVPRWRGRAAAGAVVLNLVFVFLVPTRAMEAWTLAVGVGLIAFLDWPRGAVHAHWPRACGWPMALRIALGRHDHDHRVVWPFPADPNGELEVEADGARLHDWHALRFLVLHSPAFHAAWLALAMAVYRLLPEASAAGVFVVVGAPLWAFLAVPSFGRRFKPPH
jgi:hypothetical protein